jgi:hypothetical protein
MRSVADIVAHVFEVPFDLQPLGSNLRQAQFENDMQTNVDGAHVFRGLAQARNWRVVTLGLSFDLDVYYSFFLLIAGKFHCKLTRTYFPEKTRESVTRNVEFQAFVYL